MRARMALMYSGIRCELREVLLRDKPQAMLAVSKKATVPVLLVDDQVIDESIDVMKWALNQIEADGWNRVQLNDALLEQNDGEFKAQLDRYKYHDRYPEFTQREYFERALGFIDTLEQSMVPDGVGDYYLKTPNMSALDAAIFPFVRQFAHVDRAAFEKLAFVKVQSWLAARLASPLFNSVMVKYSIWQEGQEPVLFGNLGGKQ